MSNGNARSRSAMMGLVVIAVLVFAFSASAQTRPNLSNDFQSAVTIQTTTGTGQNAKTVVGVGKIYIDFTNIRARQVLAYDETFDILTLYSDDPTQASAVYTVNLDNGGCQVQKVMLLDEPLFGWVAQSKQEGSVEVNGIEGTEWVATSTNPMITLVANNAGTIPLSLTYVTPEQTETITFLNYQPGEPKPSLFVKPSQCLAPNTQNSPN